MKAVVKYGQKDRMVELREVPVPDIGENDVLLEVKAAGVCGSDIEMWRHNFTYRVNTPVIQGHEFCGVVARVGRNVKQFREGDRVVSETSAYICGKCRFCKTGDYNLCPERLGFGYGTDGAFTRFVKVRQEILHLLPENLSFEEAAIIEPFCVAYNALVVRSRIEPVDSVAVIGPGPIGINCLQVARLCGASKIIIVGSNNDTCRLETARIICPEAVVLIAGKDEIPETVRKLTDGYGVDLVIDAAGNSETLQLSLEMVRRLGQITKIGWGPKPVGFSLDPLLTKSITLRGTYGHGWRTWLEVMKLVEAGKVQFRPLISHILPLGEWEKGYELVESRKGLKVLLKPLPD